MKKPSWILYLGIFLISLAAGLAIFQNKSRFGMESFSQFKELDWRDLGELDYVTGSASKKLNDLDGKEIRIPGFMVPLEDNQKKVTEFLLVPTPQACIHVPPPLPNQMVHVQMEPGHESEAAFGPIWIYGVFKIHSSRHMYGESSFIMSGLKIEPYR
jgi:hypothetical protein